MLNAYTKGLFADAEITEVQALHKLNTEATRLEKIKAAGIDYTPPSVVRTPT